MQLLNELLAQAICDGCVRVEFSNLDMKQLERVVKSRSVQLLRAVKKVVYDEYLPNNSKVLHLKEILHER